jgi:hypothetical protein
MVGEMIIARKPTAQWRLFGLDEAEISSFENVNDEEESKDEGEQVPYHLVNPDIC